MGTGLDIGFKELKSFHKRTQRRAHQEPRSEIMVKLERILGSCVAEDKIETGLCDSFPLEARQFFARERERLGAPPRVSFPLLKSHPLLYGLILFK